MVLAQSTQGTYTVRPSNAMGVSTPPKAPGKTVTGWSGSGPVSFSCRPTERDHSGWPSAARNAKTLPIFPAANTTSVCWPAIDTAPSTGEICRS